MDTAGQNAAQIGIGLQRRGQHPEGAILVGNGPRHPAGNGLEQRFQGLAGVIQVSRRPAFLGRSIDYREIELLLARVQGHEEIKNLVHHFVGAAVGLVHLVDHHDGLQAARQRLGKHELGLRHRALGGIHQQERAIDHRENPLHLAAEIGMSGGVDDVETLVLPIHRGAFGQGW